MSNLNKSKYTAEDEYPELENHKNHMAHVLTLEMYKHLRAKQTPSGYTIDHVIQSGVCNQGDSMVMSDGCVAGDEESYETFAEFFDPVIEARHRGFKPTDKNKKDQNASKLRGGVMDEKYVVSSRVRAGRSIRGFALPPWCSRAERRRVNQILSEALDEMSGNFSGKMYSVASLNENEQAALAKDSIGFSKPCCPFVLTSGTARDWPDQRAIWHNNQKNFIVWVCESDHAKVISLQKGGNMKEAFSRWCEGMQNLETNLTQANQEFQYNDHLGYVCSQPANLGTSLRASAHVRLPKLSEHNRFDEILTKLRLSKSCCGGEEGICDISNSDRIGFSEVQLVQMAIDGINFCIECEKKLGAGENINSDVDKLTQK